MSCFLEKHDKNVVPKAKGVNVPAAPFYGLAFGVTKQLRLEKIILEKMINGRISLWQYLLFCFLFQC